MQYKIPVQIENEDPILLGLSLRQLFILMAGGWVAYLIFTSLEPVFGGEIALLPSGLIAATTFAIAVFKIHEMTFIPFVLSILRKNINVSERSWQSGVDSWEPMDIWYLTSQQAKTQEEISLDEKAQSLEQLQEKLKNI